MATNSGGLGAIIKTHLDARRPRWAAYAYDDWHKDACDHNDPQSCGFEGQPWIKRGEGWSRTSIHGTTVIFFEDGQMGVWTPATVAQAMVSA